MRHRICDFARKREANLWRASAWSTRTFRWRHAVFDTHCKYSTLSSSSVLCVCIFWLNHVMKVENAPMSRTQHICIWFSCACTNWFFFYEKLFDGFIMHQNNFFVPAPFALKCDLIAYNLHIFFLNKDRPNRVCARSMKLYDWNYYLILTSSYNTKKCMHAKWISIHLIKWIKIIM